MSTDQHHQHHQHDPDADREQRRPCHTAPDRTTRVVALVIGRSTSSCSACGRSTLPHGDRHDAVSGWEARPGCGAVWTHVTTDCVGDGIEGPDGSAHAVRPDLPWIDYGDVPRRDVATPGRARGSGASPGGRPSEQDGLADQLARVTAERDRLAARLAAVDRRDTAPGLVDLAATRMIPAGHLRPGMRLAERYCYGLGAGCAEGEHVHLADVWPVLAVDATGHTVQIVYLDADGVQQGMGRHPWVLVRGVVDVPDVDVPDDTQGLVPEGGAR